MQGLGRAGGMNTIPKLLPSFSFSIIAVCTLQKKWQYGTVPSTAWFGRPGTVQARTQWGNLWILPWPGPDKKWRNNPWFRTVHFCSLSSVKAGATAASSVWNVQEVSCTWWSKCAVTSVDCNDSGGNFLYWGNLQFFIVLNTLSILLSNALYSCYRCGYLLSSYLHLTWKKSKCLHLGCGYWISLDDRTQK